MSATRSFLVTILLLINAPLVYSAEQTDSDPQPFVIDPEHTHVTFQVERFGFANTLGVFPDSQGRIKYNPDRPEQSHVSASVDVASVWTGSNLRDEHVRSEHWLHAEQFPTLRFESSAVESLDQSALKVSGTLTMWGVEQAVTFDVHVNKLGGDPARNGQQALGFSAKALIERSEFGHTTAAALIGDQVLISIEGLAHQVPVETAQQ